MKRIVITSCIIMMCCMLIGCIEVENGESDDLHDITLTHGSDYYHESNISLEDVIQEYEELGFTDIKQEACRVMEYEPYEIVKVRIDKDEFHEGDMVPSNACVQIYYNDYSSVNTAENCNDLEVILSGDIKSYKSFAEEYDGELVEFDAIISYYYTDNLYTIIEVKGKDEAENIKINTDVLLTQYIDLCDISEGDYVHIFGKVNKRSSEYYDMLCIDAQFFQKIEQNSYN